MEGSEAGATATATTFAMLPGTLSHRDSPLDFASNQLTAMTSNERAVSHENTVSFTSNENLMNGLITGPNVEDLVGYNLGEDAIEQHPPPFLKTEEIEADGLLALAGVNNSLTNGVPDAQQDWHNADTMPFPDLQTAGLPDLYDQPTASPAQRSFRALQEDNNQVQAYALLKFPDGDFYVKSTQVLLGRDMSAWEQYQKEKKRARKAQEAVELYRQEPSQPSQRGDDDPADPSSKSSQSMEGRPAKSLPSNLSETGGIMRVEADSDDEILSKKKRRRRRIANISKSSSTTSVAPANLHMNATNLATGSPFNNSSADPPECVRLGVHPQNPEDMGKISREHLLLYFNFEEQRWDLEVKGSGVYIKDTRHYRGEIVPLSHDDEIIFATVMFRFKLPDQSAGEGDVSTFGDAESDLAASQQLSETADEQSQLDALQEQKKSGFKLKLGKREKEQLAKANLQDGDSTQQVDPASASLLDEKPAAKESGTAVTAQNDAGVTARQQSIDGQLQPSLPENVPMGSVFEGVKPEELPQKRKGPGRPPKNGLISKRDEGFIKRRRKEYEKRGEEPPPLDELLAIIRAENKEKERLAKLAAAGQGGMPPPATHGTEVPPGVVHSIESSETVSGTAPSAPSSSVQTDAQGKKPSDSAAPSDPGRKSSPKPRRTVKSPSPQKPESAYTEEELKKPTQTYIILIDEALRNHPTGIMDLQEIYDKICKRYPYYRYRANTTGWQSSVRHNLISCERFIEAGKQGKGRLWKIDYSYAIDRDRKRRETAQDMSRAPAMHGGQMPRPFPPGHAAYMQQPQVQGSNGPQPNYQSVQQQMQAGMQRAGAGYYSPYNGPNGGQGGPSQTNMQPGQRPLVQGQAQQGQTAPHGQQAGSGSNQSDSGGVFNLVVNAIMEYRSQYLRRFLDTPQYSHHEDLFKKCTNFVSNVYQGEEVKDDELSNDEEKRVFGDLKSIIARFKAVKNESAKPDQSEKVEGQRTDGQVMRQQQAAIQSGGSNPVPMSSNALPPNATSSGGAGGQQVTLQAQISNQDSMQAAQTTSMPAQQQQQQQQQATQQAAQQDYTGVQGSAQSTGAPAVISQQQQQQQQQQQPVPLQTQVDSHAFNQTAQTTALILQQAQQASTTGPAPAASANVSLPVSVAPAQPSLAATTQSATSSGGVNASSNTGPEQQVHPPHSSEGLPSANVNSPSHVEHTQQGQATPAVDPGMPDAAARAAVMESQLSQPAIQASSAIIASNNNAGPSMQSDKVVKGSSPIEAPSSANASASASAGVVTGAKRSIADDHDDKEGEPKRMKIE